MTATHTPGPWNWNETCLVAEPSRDYPNGYAVAKVFNESDVALIAAAPDLLAALRTLVDYFGPHPDVDNGLDEALTAARAAIARATKGD